MRSVLQGADVTTWNTARLLTAIKTLSITTLHSRRVPAAPHPRLICSNLRGRGGVGSYAVVYTAVIDINIPEIFRATAPRGANLTSTNVHSRHVSGGLTLRRALPGRVFHSLYKWFIQTGSAPRYKASGKNGAKECRNLTWLKNLTRRAVDLTERIISPRLLFVFLLFANMTIVWVFNFLC